MHPGVAQCRNCWCWGHPTHACCAQGAKCQKCGGPHRVENHRSMAWCYKANPKSNPPREATAVGAPCPHTFKCLNCKGEHFADDTKCPFWRHYFCQMCSRQSLSKMLVIDYVVGHLTLCVIPYGLEVGTLSLTVVHR